MIFNKKEMSTAVLDRLSKLQKLPKSGFLSGGAVANTILSIVDSKEYPINDLDIFIVEDDMGDTISNTPIRTDDEITFQDRYENIITSPDLQNSYKIKSTSLDGLINYVYVHFRRPISNENDYMRILKSFDINCCKVGIDLSNGNMIIDQDFIDFLNTRQLECTTPVTPAHSVLRLVKKRDELNAYLDKESSFKFLSQFYHFNENVFLCKLNISFFFGQKYKDLYFKYQSEISEYFQLKTYAQCFKEKHKEFVNNLIKTTQCNWWDIDHLFFNENMQMWHSKNVFTIVPTKYTSLDEQINEFLRPQYKNNPVHVKTLWNLLYGQNKKQKDKSLKILNDTNAYIFIMKNDKFHLCDFTDKNIEHFSRFVGNNRKVENLILTSKLNFQESEKMIYIIKKFFPQEIDMLSDILSKQILSDEIDCSKLTDKNYIIEKYGEVKKILSTPYREYLNLNDFDFKNEVKELNSEFDLLWGGKYMHNCLSNGGFGERITNGKIRVFIISDSDNRSAVQLNNNNGIYTISQIYGISNGPTNKKHRLISQYLVEYLNYKHYLLESKKRISMFEEIKSSVVSEINSLDSTTIDDNNHINIYGIDYEPNNGWVDF